jgi:hypothetical protein
VAILQRTLAMSYTPQPDYQTVYWRLQDERYAPLLATDTFDYGTPYTMPATLCAWWGLGDALRRDRLQTQASHMRACRRPRRGASR